MYLPAEDLDRFGCGFPDASPGPDSEGGDGTVAGPMAELIRFEADRARRWYATGLQLIPLLDRRSAACTGAMAGIYRRLLEHIAARPEAALAGQDVAAWGREKALIACGGPLAGRDGPPEKGRCPAIKRRSAMSQRRGGGDRRRAGWHHRGDRPACDRRCAVTLLELPATGWAARRRRTSAGEA